jgi:hypothetical protein
MLPVMHGHDEAAARRGVEKAPMSASAPAGALNVIGVGEARPPMIHRSKIELVRALT